MLGILLGSLMCSSGVDSLPLGTEAKVEAYLYENGYRTESGQVSGFTGGLWYVIARVENNAVAEFIGNESELAASTNKAGFTTYANSRLAAHINQIIAPRGAGEYAVWISAFEGYAGVYDTAKDFKRFFATGTPGSINFDSSVTNVTFVRVPRLAVSYPNAKRVVIRGEGFNHDSMVDPTLLTTLKNASGEVTIWHIHIPREVTTNTVGVIEVTLNDNTVERFCLETGKKVPNVAQIAIVSVDNGKPKLVVIGEPRPYIIQCSTNFVDWHTMTNITIEFTTTSVIDSGVSDRKFYRVKIAP